MTERDKSFYEKMKRYESASYNNKPILPRKYRDRVSCKALERERAFEALRREVEGNGIRKSSYVDIG